MKHQDKKIRKTTKSTKTRGKKIEKHPIRTRFMEKPSKTNQTRAQPPDVEVLKMFLRCFLGK